MKTLIMILTGIGLWAPFWTAVYFESRYVQKLWLRLMILIFILATPTIIWIGYLKPWFKLNF